MIDLLMNRCPSCRKGAVFTGLYRMNETCPSCGIRFEREQGYFLGSMIVAYVMSVVSMIPTIVYLVRVAEASTFAIILIPSIQVLLMNPLFFMYSRLAWMYVDRGANPKNWN